jgi:hypothetical protein
MPWQKWLAEHSLKIKSDGRYQHPMTVATVARQNGKSTYMMARILMGSVSLERIVAGFISSSTGHIAGAISRNCSNN